MPNAIQVSEFGGPEVLQVVNIEVPSPGPGQVRVQVSAIGVNPVDTYIRSGQYAFRPQLPYTPGSDGAGVVESVGPGVTDRKIGERVYFIGSAAGPYAGAYAEMVLCQADFVFALPDGLSFEQGAALGVPFATAFRALHDRAQAREGELVLIHGATGGVGMAAVQLARISRLRIIATGGTTAGRDLLRQLGADFVLDHHHPEVVEQIREISDGKGVDVVLEMLANVNLQKDLQLLAHGGRVVVIGSRGDIQITPRLMMGKESAVMGMALWASGSGKVRSAHVEIERLLQAGQLKPVVGRSFKLSQAPQAHQAVMEKGAMGKIVLIPG